MDSKPENIHILSARVIVMGERVISREEWPKVSEHIIGCKQCLSLLHRYEENPVRLRARKAMHPDSETLVWMALSTGGLSVPPLFPISPEELEDVQRHLQICYGCCKDFELVVSDQKRMNN